MKTFFIIYVTGVIISLIAAIWVHKRIKHVPAWFLAAVSLMWPGGVLFYFYCIIKDRLERYASED